MSGNKAMRRALETTDAIRVNANIPAITDKTELITPEYARELLKSNKRNRPINWKKVEEYAALMKVGQWQLHAQGIVLDTDGNILTGQKRLWAVVYAGVNVYFRVSRGNPPSVAKLLDRGTPQTARDLASRETERKHSPMESSIARAIAVASGMAKPSVDDLANIMSQNADIIAKLLKETHGTKKTRAALMILAALVIHFREYDHHSTSEYSVHLEKLVDQLEAALKPESAERCWGKGVAFALAMKQAREIVSRA